MTTPSDSPPPDPIIETPPIESISVTDAPDVVVTDVTAAEIPAPPSPSPPVDTGSTVNEVNSRSTVNEVNSKNETDVAVPPAPKPIDTKLRIFLETIPIEDITQLLEKRRLLLGDEDFATEVETIGTYENTLTLLYNDHSVESERSIESLSRITDADRPLFDQRLVQNGKTVLGSLLNPRRVSGQGKLVYGAEGRFDFAIKSGAMKRVSLYNSGFFVDIKAPTLSALNQFFTKAHNDTNQYGREFGAHFFYFNDLFIKEAVIELIEPIILNSNLRGWNRGTTLLRNIKLVDYKVILNAIAVLMFPDGFKFTHVCTNPAGTCTHHEERLIDILHLFRYNFAKLSTKCIMHMAEQKEVTAEQLAAYQTELGLGSRTIRHDTHYEFELQVPSIASYLAYGKTFNGVILGSNFADNAVDIYRTLQYSYYRVYTPFISKLTFYDDKGVVDIATTDAEVISDQLAQIQANDPDLSLIKQLDGFIADTEITHIAYPAFACPVCGYIPETGYYTVDSEHAFFIMSIMRLVPS